MASSSSALRSRSDDRARPGTVGECVLPHGSDSRVRGDDQPAARRGRAPGFHACVHRPGGCTRGHLAESSRQRRNHHDPSRSRRYHRQGRPAGRDVRGDLRSCRGALQGQGRVDARGGCVEGIWGANGIVAAGMPIAVGAGLSFLAAETGRRGRLLLRGRRDRKRGDPRGAQHGLTVASSRDLRPGRQPLRRVDPGGRLSGDARRRAYAASYGVHAEHVDGNDVERVADAAARAVARARVGRARPSCNARPIASTATTSAIQEPADPSRRSSTGRIATPSTLPARH